MLQIIMFPSYCLSVLFMAQLHYVESLKVDLPVGSISGKEEVTAEGNKFHSFLGIPYGEPPVGNKRFQAPVEKGRWEGVHDGTREGHICYQMRADNSNADEDCLIINVFTPEIFRTKGPLPVMFYIYGGGFVDGSSDRISYSPDHYMDKEVILVTFNYRIGSFGFLSFNDIFAPGNAGLKDQVLALKWTNKYIQHFGGDHHKITIFGQSAGGASVAYHLLNEKTSDLYRAAILLSGTSLCPWAFQRNLPEVSHKLAQRINDAEYSKIKNSSKALLEFLQSVPAGDIEKATRTDFPDMTVPRYNVILDGFYFTPTIETEHDGAVLTENMFGLLESGKFNRVPIMLGFTTLEWGFLKFDPNFGNIINAFDDDNTLVVPRDLKAKPDDQLRAAKEIYNFYTQGKHFKDNNRTLLEYFSDQGLTTAIRKHAELASKYTEVYFYQFAYKGRPGGAPESVVGFSDDVFHVEDLFYSFAGVYNNVDAKNWSKWNDLDRTTGQRMIQILTNFAKFRNPTPYKEEILGNITWPKFEPTEKYLNIGSLLEIKEHPKEDMFRMWENIYNKYGSKPFDSY